MVENTIQRYDHETETLARSHDHKVRKIIDHGCLKHINLDHWLCQPILGYNVTTYNLTRREDGAFRCDCQGYRKRLTCSHVDALNIVNKELQPQGTFF